jgi:hypothetical protein
MPLWIHSGDAPYGRAVADPHEAERQAWTQLNLQRQQQQAAQQLQERKLQHDIQMALEQQRFTQQQAQQGQANWERQQGWAEGIVGRQKDLGAFQHGLNQAVNRQLFGHQTGERLGAQEFAAAQASAGVGRAQQLQRERLDAAAREGEAQRKAAAIAQAAGIKAKKEEGAAQRTHEVGLKAEDISLALQELEGRLSEGQATRDQQMKMLQLNIEATADLKQADRIHEKVMQDRALTAQEKAQAVEIADRIEARRQQAQQFGAQLIHEKELAKAENLLRKYIAEGGWATQKELQQTQIEATATEGEKTRTHELKKLGVQHAHEARQSSAQRMAAEREGAARRLHETASQIRAIAAQAEQASAARGHDAQSQQRAIEAKAALAMADNLLQKQLAGEQLSMQEQRHLLELEKFAWSQETDRATIDLQERAAARSDAALASEIALGERGMGIREAEEGRAAEAWAAEQARPPEELVQSHAAFRGAMAELEASEPGSAEWNAASQTAVNYAQEVARAGGGTEALDEALAAIRRSTAAGGPADAPGLAEDPAVANLIQSILAGGVRGQAYRGDPESGPFARPWVPHQFSFTPEMANALTGALRGMLTPEDLETAVQGRLVDLTPEEVSQMAKYLRGTNAGAAMGASSGFGGGVNLPWSTLLEQAGYRTR